MVKKTRRFAKWQRKSVFGSSIPFSQGDGRKEHGEEKRRTNVQISKREKERNSTESREGERLFQQLRN